MGNWPSPRGKEVNLIFDSRSSAKWASGGLKRFELQRGLRRAEKRAQRKEKIAPLEERVFT